MEFKFIPIDYDYFDYEAKNYIKIVGRTKNNKKVCLIDYYEPFFWVVLKNGISKKRINELVKRIEKLEVHKASRVSKVLKTKIVKKNFLEKEVLAIEVFVTNFKDCHAIASEIGECEDIVARRGYDISIITKYIMDEKIRPFFWYKVKGEVLASEDFGGISNSLDVDFCIKLEKFSEAKKEVFEPKVLAYDIECDNIELGKGKILMISVFGDNVKKVFTWKKSSKSPEFVEFFDNEAEMIEAFVSEVKKYSPDILCGYFSDGFDLVYLKERAKKNKIKLALGIDSSEPVFSRGIIPNARIRGIVHVDLYKFIASVYSQYLSSETLGLNEVASELIGETKDDFDFSFLANMDDSKWNDFFSYNLKDSKVTYNLFSKIWPDLFEFSRVITEPLFYVSRDSMATHVENYILHNLYRFNEIPEKSPINDEILERRSKGKYEGAFVFEPKPGFYEDIVMFDFTSMYGSVIVSYNLSKGTFEGKTEDGSYRFSKKQGFFPRLLSEIIELRKKSKKEYALKKDNLSKARSNAYKLLANASYGYLGFFGARYYCREAASSAARLAREHILSVIEKIKKRGYEVLYSDTDSVSFLKKNKSKKEVLEFLKELNKNLPGIMELDLEDFYKRGIFVAKRTKNAGAKKKYALIDEKANLKIRGFETVRRDWCSLSRKLQNNVLKLILTQGNEKKAVDVLINVVKDLKERKVNLNDLIIRTQLKKSINEYVSKGPHVIAAEKMQKLNLPITSGMVVEYYIGEGSGKRIGDRVFLPNEKANYDINYYLNNQILPAVENIFEVFGINVDEILNGQKQTGLSDFG